MPRRPIAGERRSGGKRVSAGSVEAGEEVDVEIGEHRRGDVPPLEIGTLRPGVERPAHIDDHEVGIVEVSWSHSTETIGPNSSVLTARSERAVTDDGDTLHATMHRQEVVGGSVLRRPVVPHHERVGPQRTRHCTDGLMIWRSRWRRISRLSGSTSRMCEVNPMLV